jgi:hypothetical protein
VKWRFFWRVGDRPQQTQYPELNAAPVVPQVRPGRGIVLHSSLGLYLRL